MRHHNHNSLSRVPIRLDRALADEVACLLTDEYVGDHRRVLERKPEPALKSRLRVRLEELNAGLLPARPADIAQRVAQMFLGFGSRPDDANAVAAQYVSVLRQLPLWAIAYACERFENGAVTESECPKWNASYVPSTAQLCRRAEKAVAKFNQEMSDINDVLTGYVHHVPDKEERARVSKGWAELMETLKPNAREREKRWASVRNGTPMLGDACTSALAKSLREADEVAALAGTALPKLRPAPPLVEPEPESENDDDETG